MKFKRSHKIALILLSIVLFVVWIESEQRFVVKGRVVDASTGEPVEGASIAIHWSGTHLAAVLAPYASGYYEIEQFRSTSDEDGYFEIPKYFLTSFDMGVYKKGYVCWSSDSIFTKGLDLETREQIKKKIWFRVHNGMKIKLEKFTDEYPRFDHASFINAVASATGGLEGAGEEIKYYIDKKWNKKNEK